MYVRRSRHPCSHVASDGCLFGLQRGFGGRGRESRRRRSRGLPLRLQLRGPLGRRVRARLRAAGEADRAAAPPQADPRGVTPVSRFRPAGRSTSMGDSGAHWTIYESPIGPLTLVAGPGGLTDLNFPGRFSAPAGTERRPLPEVTRQLDAYFAGELREFDLPLDPRGTPLELAVWRALLEIPYGQTASYGEQAAKIDPALFDADVE